MAYIHSRTTKPQELKGLLGLGLGFGLVFLYGLIALIYSGGLLNVHDYRCQ